MAEMSQRKKQRYKSYENCGISKLKKAFWDSVNDDVKDTTNKRILPGSQFMKRVGRKWIGSYCYVDMTQQFFGTGSLDLHALCRFQFVLSYIKMHGGYFIYLS